MRYLLFILFFGFLTSSYSQNDFLAKQYLNDGAYEKALVFYEKLVIQQPRRMDYVEGIITCYQQLEKYTEAENHLLEKIKSKYSHPVMNIELGYNYALQDNQQKASFYYQQAISKIDENPNYGYGIGFRFQRYALLNYAIQAYSKAMEVNPELDYNFQLARIYGEQGNIEKMYDHHLQQLQNGKISKSNVLRSIDDFITSDAVNDNNIKLKKSLLLRAQKKPDVLWNELLSWLYVQQKQYKSAFNQEKAVYKRSEASSLHRLQSLGGLTLNDNETEIAQDIFKYIVDNATDLDFKLNAQLNLIDIDLINDDDKTLSQVEQTFEKLLGEYGYNEASIKLQVAYANFLTFKKDKAEAAIELLKNSLQLPLHKFEEANIKLALGDILVFDKKFNEALIYFTQVQQKLKNDVLGQNARYKVAQASFYKGDFDWAHTQLKVLRSSTSQLIANDAMQLSLLISDNSLEDSTQTALKKYALADLLGYQNKTKEAITTLDDILENHKGEKIEDEALLRQAQLLESQKEYEAARFNYQKIVEFYSTDILADDAHFALAELYRIHLNEPEKAKEHYEKIIYNYQDSYYFPQARKHFRILRGDFIN